MALPTLDEPGPACHGATAASSEAERPARTKIALRSPNHAASQASDSLSVEQRTELRSAISVLASGG